MNETRFARTIWGCLLILLAAVTASCQPVIMIQIVGPDIPFEKPAIGYAGKPTSTPASVEVATVESETVTENIATENSVAEDAVAESTVTEDAVAENSVTPSPTSTSIPEDRGLTLAEALACLDEKSTVYGIALANSNVRAVPEVDGCYMGRVPSARIVRITQAYVQGDQQPYHDTIQTTAAVEQAPATATSSIGYIEDIQPIFQNSCAICHGGEPQSGGLKATEYDPLMAGGKSGRVVIPGDSRRSLLWYQVSNGIMPMTGPLPEAEQQLIKAWIDAGAPEQRVAVQPSVQQADESPSPANPLPGELWWLLIRDDVDLVQNSCDSYIEDPGTLVSSALIAPIGCNTVPSRSAIDQIVSEYQVELPVAEAASSTPTLEPTIEVIESPVVIESPSLAIAATSTPLPPIPTLALFPTPLPAPAVDVLFPTYTPLPVPLFTPAPYIEPPTPFPTSISTFTPMPMPTNTPMAVAIVSGQSVIEAATATTTPTTTPTSTPTSTPTTPFVPSATSTPPLPTAPLPTALPSTAVPPTSTPIPTSTPTITPTPTLTPTPAPSATPTLSTTEANIRVSPLGLSPPSDADPWLIPQGGYCIQQRLPRNERSITALAFAPDGRLFMALDSSPANEPDPFIFYDAYHPSRSIAVYDTVNDSGFGEILVESGRVTGLDYHNGALYVSRAGEVGYIPDGGQYQALAGGFAVDGRLFHANNGLTILNNWLYISAGGLMDGYTDGPIVGMSEQQAQVTVAKGNLYASRLVRAPVDRLVSERSINVFQTVARGFRNPYGLASDVYGRLWITDNGATNVPNSISAGDEVSMFDPRMLSADAIAGNEEATPYYGFPLALNGASPSWYTGPIVDLPNASAPTGVTWAYDTVFFGVYGTKPGLYRVARAADGRMIAERIMLVWPLIAVTTAPDGSLWIGTGEGGLYRMTPGC